MRAVPEGLAYSEDHCARVLSVAGFFTVPGPFLLGREVYSEGEREAFLPGMPLSFNNPGITVTPVRVPGPEVYQQWYVPGMYRVVHLLGAYREAYTGWDTLLLAYPGRHIPLF